jgi:hypothetical protein
MILLSNIPTRNWQELKTINDITDRTFAEAARIHGLILDRQHEASMVILLARDLRTPPSDPGFIFVLVIESGAGYQMLFDEFKDAMSNDGDNDDSIRKKIKTIVARIRLTMEALKIEGAESITIDDDRSVSLNALAPEQAAITREMIDGVQSETKKAMLL